MAARKAETFLPVTMGHTNRSHGCRDLLAYCDSGRCHHNALMNAGLASRRDTTAVAVFADGAHQVRNDRCRHLAARRRLSDACR
jgi:hypothetical protein